MVEYFDFIQGFTFHISRQRIPETNVYYYKSPEHRFEKKKEEKVTDTFAFEISDRFDKSLFSNNYVLSFAFAFDRDEEKYQFALAYPYSYSRYPYSYSRYPYSYSRYPYSYSR